MRKVVWLVAALAFTVSPAFAQNFIGEDPVTRSGDSVSDETDVYLKPSLGPNDAAATFSKLMFNELERSRQLKGVEVVGSTTLQIEAPLGMVADAAGKNVMISYDMIPPRGEPRSYVTSCRSNRLEDCAKAIILRAERLAREATALRR